jgi:hypothetical protein
MVDKKKYFRQYYMKHRESILAKVNAKKEWATDPRKQYMREYYQKRAKQIRMRRRCRYIDNRDKDLATMRRWRSVNKKRIKYYSAMRKQYVKKATPPWADLNAIRLIYENCPNGYHVDHVIPLRGKTISGLHVASNLQYLKAVDNLRKNNRFVEV